MVALSTERIRAGLTTDFMGRNLVYLPEVGSTNDKARELAGAGAPEGTLVVADHQTAGRGRLGRRWEAPFGAGLLMSLVFRPTLGPHQMQWLTMICGLAVVDSVESETGLQAALKWPNDVVVGGAKAGGILTEFELGGVQPDSQVDWAVVGIGLNVNLDPSQLPGDLLVPATSLSQVLGCQVARLPLLWAFLEALEARYLVLESGHSPHREWAARLVTLDRPVTVSTSDRVLEGVAEGVDVNGALLVRLANGGLETVVAGDVTLRVQD